MDVGNVGGRLGKARGDFNLLPFEFGHPRFHSRLIQPILDRRHDPGDGALDRRKRPLVGIDLNTLLAVLPVDVGGIGGNGGIDLVSRDQPVANTRERSALQLLAPDCPAVGAVAAAMMTDAAIAVIDDDGIGAAADAALKEARKQIGGTPRIQERAGPRRLPDPGMALGKRRLLALGRLPHLVADDAKLGHLVPDPFGFGIEARDPLAAARIGDIMFVVPDADADIKLVVDDAGAASHVAADAGIAPRKPLRTGDAIGVEVARNAERALAVRELAEDALDDQCLHRIDLAFAAYQLALAGEAADHPVAIADRTGREALLDPPTQAAMRLLREVFQEQCVHRPLEPDMQLGDFTFGEGDERHPCKLEMLVEGRDIGLIARYAVERFGHDDIELARLCIGKQLLDTGTQDHARSRDRRVLETADNLPSLACRVLAADALLVGDGCRVLLVGGIAGVERGADHGVSLSSGGQQASPTG